MYFSDCSSLTAGIAKMDMFRLIHMALAELLLVGWFNDLTSVKLSYCPKILAMQF